MLIARLAPLIGVSQFGNVSGLPGPYLAYKCPRCRPHGTSHLLPLVAIRLEGQVRSPAQ
jgi:hypothetical protein